jgi:hypothetical protein
MPALDEEAIGKDLIMPLQLIPTDSILPDIMSFVERAEP